MKIFTSKENLRSQKSFLIEEDIFSDLAIKKGSSLLLGKYSMTEATAVLRKRSFFKEAQKRNLWPIEFELDSSEFPPIQRLQIFHKLKRPDSLIVDLKIREGMALPKKKLEFAFSLSNFNFLVLEWLTLQNPLLSFSPEKSPLPGQSYPGLGFGKKVVDLFVYLARINRNDGILVFPAYFHNALLFSRFFHFFNPEKKGEVLAVRKSLSDIPFKKLAWIVHLNCLKGQDKKIYEWEAEEQVFPLNRTLKDYFDSKAYKEKVKETERRQRYFVDWECYERKRNELD